MGKAPGIVVSPWSGRVLSCLVVFLAFIVFSLVIVVPYPAWAQATLENPQEGSFQSGIGLVSGWVCNAGRIDIEFDGTATLQVAYGTSREDTRSICSDANNGFGVLINWNLLGDGIHTVRALADGVEFGRATITVATFGVEFFKGAAGSFPLRDFPKAGGNVTVRWQESAQNFVIERVDSLARLQAKLHSLTWLAYAPTHFDPTLGCPTGFPTAESIRTDLELAHAHGFTGLITFAADCTLAEIPRLAKEAGFEGVIMGLFLFNEVLRQEEITNAKAAAAYVDGYGIGNEGLIGCGGTFYTSETLLQTMEEIRTATQKPVTTSEQIEDYLNGGCLNGFLLTHGDWLFPITHPFNNGIRDPEAGVNFTTERFQSLSGLTDKAVFFKETGWPTGGDLTATEEHQEAYFLLLQNSATRYAYFEGFDQPWKTGTTWEPFWGVFQQNRAPKLFLSRNVP